MVVLVGDQPLGDSAHGYYDTLVAKFEVDTGRGARAQLQGDMVTAAGSRAATARPWHQLNLAGDQGSTKGNKSVDAVREIIRHPPGHFACLRHRAARSPPIHWRPATAG